MYGIKDNSTIIPPMPLDGDTWSVTNSWAMPTKSYLEFVMFSRSVDNFCLVNKAINRGFVQFKATDFECVHGICRMFVDALDAQVYNEHHGSGLCYLSLSKVSF